MGENIAIRDAYGAALKELGEQNEKIVGLEADVASSTKSGIFGKAFPERYFNVGISELDIAKRLIDCGIHPPTIYFPLVVHGAIMIEPTESENLEDLDAFIEAMRSIAELAETDADLLHASPTRTKVGRVDEVGAARKPVLTGDM